MSFLSVALFADAGEARADWQDVDLKRHANRATASVLALHIIEQTRLSAFDVGTGGGEGWQIFLKIFPTF